MPADDPVLAGTNASADTTVLIDTEKTSGTQG